jgi:hypothetical protein
VNYDIISVECDHRSHSQCTYEDCACICHDRGESEIFPHAHHPEEEDSRL